MPFSLLMYNSSKSFQKAAKKQDSSIVAHDLADGTLRDSIHGLQAVSLEQSYFDII